MTPAQLKTFVAVVRHGSSRAAAHELGVGETAVSNHIKALRTELDDQLFRRSGGHLVFTPGGLRLATRSLEMLGLQDQTRAEVLAAADGQRLLRLATSSLFAEYSAPGLIELFATRAKDLRVELSVYPAHQFADLLVRRAVDLALGPRLAAVSSEVVSTEFVRYQMVPVVGRSHRLAGKRLSIPEAHQQQWLLGPEALDVGGVANRMLTDLAIPDTRQLVFQSSEAAISEARSGQGIALALAHRVANEMKVGRLAAVDVGAGNSHGTWTAYSLERRQLTPAASELLRFISSPRAMQAVLKGSGAHIARFRPSVHVTLWS
ncbi:MAG: LysR family transcriptional regulator [Acidimicrobiales bacterium]|nr:LysR family transcriptional regulator [Acidimicrobiales bacterium]